jgi:type II secretory pathway component PulK
MTGRSGIALIAVMAALMVMSAMGLALAVAVQAEARMDRADFDALQAEELARSGHEFAAFIEARGLTKTADFLAGSPFEAVTPGFHYRAHTPSGVVDIYFEADNGKINLSSAPADLIRNFFELWSGDPVNAARLAAAVEDWRDPDNDLRPDGAEAADYSGAGFSPRNSALGIADLPLIRGFRPADFQLKLLHGETGPEFREPLGAFYTDAAAGNAVNVNFASELMLRAVPGLTDRQIAGTINGRKNRLFDDPNDFQARGGIPPDSPAWRYLTVARSAPAVLAVARLNGSGVVRRERRVVYSFSDFFSPTVEPRSAIGEIEKFSEITDER